MGIAAKVKKYLDTRAITYSLLTHEYSEGSLNTASAAHIDKSSLAKGVLVRDEDFHYTLCVLPSNKKILRHTLNQIFDRHMSLVEEDELNEIFSDCAPGAIPALGDAYGLDVIWDDELMAAPKVFLEAGDHRHLICMEQREFLKLMEGKLHERFSGEKTRHKHLSNERIAA